MTFADDFVSPILFLRSGLDFEPLIVHLMTPMFVHVLQFRWVLISDTPIKGDIISLVCSWCCFLVSEVRICFLGWLIEARVSD